MATAPPASLLEDLPRECLDAVLGGLAAGDVRSAMQCSTTMRDAGTRFWRDALFRDFGFVAPTEEEEDDGRRWRRLYDAISDRIRPGRTHLKGTGCLRVNGIYCDGGVDECAEEQWFRNVFDHDAHDRFYCSAASSNVSVIGCVVAGERNEAHGYDEYRLERRAYMTRRCNLNALMLTAFEEDRIRAQSDEGFVPRPFRTVLKHCKTSGEIFDFGRWPDSRLLQFFVARLQAAHDGDPVAALLFDGVDGVDDGDGDGTAETAAMKSLAQRVKEASVEEAIPTSSENTDADVGQRHLLKREIERARRCADDATSPPPPPRPEHLVEERTLEARLARERASFISNHAASLPECPGGRAHGGEPLRLLATEGAMAAFGRASASEDEPAPWEKPIQFFPDEWRAAARASRCVDAIVTRVDISREGQFTCPVASGVVFFGPGPGACDDAEEVERWFVAATRRPDASGGSCGGPAAFDDVDAKEKMFNLVDDAAGSGVPKIVAVHSLEGGVAYEFERVKTPPGGRAFTPAFWFKFYAKRAGAAGADDDDGPSRDDRSPTRDVLSVRLKLPRWARCVCVKLIRCENLMHDWEDLHDNENLDVRRVALHGATIDT
jgi:hypothetical protein